MLSTDSNKKEASENTKNVLMDDLKMESLYRNIQINENYKRMQGCKLNCIRQVIIGCQAAVSIKRRV